MKFEVRLENVLEKLKLLRFPVRRWHRCGERFWQLGKSLDIVLKNCRIVVVCQLLKGQQNLVCVDRSRGILTAELQLTGTAVLILLSWRCTGEAVSNFVKNSCHHVVAIFWARVLCRLALQEACFRMKITVGFMLIRSLVCAVCVSGRLRSSSEVALN